MQRFLSRYVCTYGCYTLHVFTCHSDKIVQGALLWTSAKYYDEAMYVNTHCHLGR